MKKLVLGILAFLPILSYARPESVATLVLNMDTTALALSESYQSNWVRTQYSISNNGTIVGLRANGTIIGQLHNQALNFNVFIQDNYSFAPLINHVKSCFQMAAAAKNVAIGTGGSGSFSIAISLPSSANLSTDSTGANLEGWANKQFILGTDEVLLKNFSCSF